MYYYPIKGRGVNNMIDLHSHIMWNIDDGSENEKMTLKMLKEAESNGTKKIVATPHFLKGNFEISFNKVIEMFEKIKSLIEVENINIKVYCGQEVYYTEKILDQYINEEIGTINNSKYMLIEFPMRDFNINEILDSIYELQIKGIVPVIAHPERYYKFIKEPMLINKFIREGFLFQLNVGSICGDFGKEVKKTAEIFIKNKIYNFIGSDSHRDDKRTTNMSLGIKKIESINKVYIDEIMDSSEKLLLNEDVEFLGVIIKEKKGLFSILKR